MPDMLFTKITSHNKNLLKLNLRPPYKCSSTFMKVIHFKLIPEPHRSNFKKYRRLFTGPVKSLLQKILLQKGPPYEKGLQKMFLVDLNLILLFEIICIQHIFVFVHDYCDTFSLHLLDSDILTIYFE